MEYIITFNNTNHAIKAEQCLLKHSLHVGVLPLPAQIKAGCGICLRVAPSDIKSAICIITDNDIKEFMLYSREMANGKYVYRNRRVTGIPSERKQYL